VVNRRTITNNNFADNGDQYLNCKVEFEKLKESSNLDRSAGGEQKRKIKGGDAIAVGQYLKRNKELTVKDISMKLKKNRGLKFSPITVWRHLKNRRI
jgi:hypothetical protein